MAFLGTSHQGERRPRTAVPETTPRTPKKLRGRPLPPEATSAESFYYLKQMNARTPMVIVLLDGEKIHGWIEWYDKTCLKLNRDGAPNLVVQKQFIKYLYKQEDEV